jgi:hypothetical protein
MKRCDCKNCETSNKNEDRNNQDVSESSLNELLDAVKFLQSFVPDWAKIVPKGLGAEFYGTLSYEGDLAVKKRVDAINDLLKAKSI